VPLPGAEVAIGHALTPSWRSAVVGAVATLRQLAGALDVLTERDQICEHRLQVLDDGLDSLAIEIIHMPLVSCRGVQADCALLNTS